MTMKSYGLNEDGFDRSELTILVMLEMIVSQNSLWCMHTTCKERAVL